MIATLLPGQLSIPDSQCFYYGCTAQNAFCRVSCFLRSVNGYSLDQADDHLSLILSIMSAHNLRYPQSIEQSLTMTNHWNGTFSIDVSIVWAGDMTLRVRDDTSQQYFNDQFTTHIPLLPLDYSMSYVMSDLAESYEVGEEMVLEVLLMDSNENIICNLPNEYDSFPYEVIMELEMESVSDGLTLSNLDYLSIFVLFGPKLQQLHTFPAVLYLCRVLRCPHFDSDSGHNSFDANISSFFCCHQRHYSWMHTSGRQTVSMLPATDLPAACKPPIRI